MALVPEVVAKIAALGAGVTIETGAGGRAGISDDAFVAAGATVASSDTCAAADIVTCVGPEELASVSLRSGQVVVGLLRPWQHADQVRAWAAAGLTTIALDYLPRTLSRAQVMDALTSQASVAGYKAAIVAADAYGGFFPMLMTAAGTVKPAQVLVLGAGVAGLQAIATARRLGASVSGYDVRPAAREEVASLGAKFVEVPGVDAAGSGGYARELTAAERAAQQAALNKHIARADVVITTAQVPGRKPPLLVTEEALATMGSGSVLVDMGASSLGGNVAGSLPGQTVVTAGGVSIIGADDLASRMAPAASVAYARNITALLGLIVKDGVVSVDLADEVVGAMVVTHGGEIVGARAREALGLPPLTATEARAVDTAPATGGRDTSLIKNDNATDTADATNSGSGETS